MCDKAAQPMTATSRWNEGKIHLGYLYAADPTLRTAQHVIPGGLRFAPLVRQLLGTDLDGHVTTSDDTCLIHRDSLVDAAGVRAQFDAVSALIRNHPDGGDYFADLSGARTVALSPAELADLGGHDVVAGFRVPERSVDTRWVPIGWPPPSRRTTGSPSGRIPRCSPRPRSTTRTAGGRSAHRRGNGAI